MIKFLDYKNGKINLLEVSSLLRSNIPKEDYFQLSTISLAFKALSLFNFKKIEETSSSVATYAQKVIDVTGFFKKSQDPIRDFLIIYLNVGSELLQIKNHLENQAKNHLKAVEDVLNYYENLPFIRRYINEPVLPRSAQERKELVFYKRALAKKSKIIDYLIYGVLDRALEKASPNYRQRWKKLSDIESTIEKADDFPYFEFQYSLNYEYTLGLEHIDFRLINPLKNKLQWYNSRIHTDTSYTPEIDAELEKNILPKSFFKDLIISLKDIPIVNERLPIFKEMAILFDEKKWYSLFALSLPQVEGIFSEMQEYISQKRSKNSLTDKVYNLRNAYEMAHYTFDYYEFTLADIRNHFSHTGKVDEPKKQCYRLLADIWYLLSVCIELDAPLSKLAKIIKEGAESFRHIGNISDLIRLVLQVQKEGQLLTIKQKVDTFIYKALAKKINLEKMIANLEIDYLKSLSDFDEKMFYLMNSIGGKPIHLTSCSIKDIRENIPTIKAAFEKSSFYVEEDLKLLLDTNDFLNYFEKLFPKLGRKVNSALEGFRIRQQGSLKVVNFFNEKIKLTVPDDFLLYMRKMKHYTK